jgi:hypothetical protein
MVNENELDLSQRSDNSSHPLLPLVTRGDWLIEREGSLPEK